MNASQEFVELWGTKYPIISPLSDGFLLVAHPNGPAIIDSDSISVIDQYDDDSQETIRLKREATEKFRKWAWPQLITQFHNVRPLAPADNQTPKQNGTL